MELTHEMLTKLEKLEKKFNAMGQDMNSYLDGLLYADYLTYWDYIHLDTLLSLQNAKTPFPDEEIFIIYHQITELYFKLIIKAIKQLVETTDLQLSFFIRQIKRCATYFSHLVDSFELMIDGMDKQEFLKFRMSLLPASGFQSAQYREIEILSTDLTNLVKLDARDQFSAESTEAEFYQHLYWKTGATELATGKKTLTLRQFETKYASFFIGLAKEYKHKNLRQTFFKLNEEDRKDTELQKLLKKFDYSANVQWPLMHYRSAVRYLDNKPQTIAATGGTNWQKYLPPKFQLIMFFPELWSQEEKENWGKVKIEF